jgi:MFS family permease
MVVIAWLDHLVRQAGRPELVQLTAGNGIFAALGLVSATLIGAVVASRRPAHPVGWLLLAYGLLTIGSAVATSYVGYGVVARPGALPATSAAVAVVYALNEAGAPAALLALALLLTPTGSLPSPRWRWVARALVAVTVASMLGMFDKRPLNPPLQAITSPLAIDAPPGPLTVLHDLVGVVIGGAFGLAIVAGVASLPVRFRRARGVERQQLRWLALAAALVPVAVLVSVAAALISGPAADTVITSAIGTVSWLVPLALGAAVLRYRLYDLDRIISRTLAYALLTLILGGGYVGVVLGLGQLLGRGSSLAVAVATLAVAAVFQPARRRVQDLVDRRFNRHRYDAARTIGAFSARLRQHIDLDTLTAELLAVVDQTMQPKDASLWLRPITAPQRATSTASGPTRQGTQHTPAQPGHEEDAVRSMRRDG